MTNDFLSFAGWTRTRVARLIRVACELAVDGAPARAAPRNTRRKAALLFSGPGYGTRAACECALLDLGMDPVYVPIALGAAEPIKDSARIIGDWADVVIARTPNHDDLLEYAEWSPAPVINAMTDLHHPTEVLAEIVTALAGRSPEMSAPAITFVGAAGNVCNSWFDLAARFHIDITQVCPDGGEISDWLLTTAQREGEGIARVTSSMRDGLAHADIVYTDAWWSSDARAGAEAARAEAASYRVTADVMRMAKRTAWFLHALPARRGEEVTDEVMESVHSHVLRAKRNLQYAHRAVIQAVMHVEADANVE